MLDGPEKLDFLRYYPGRETVICPTLSCGFVAAEHDGIQDTDSPNQICVFKDTRNRRSKRSLDFVQLVIRLR